MKYCTRCGKENPAEIHTCTPYFHFEKYLIGPKDIAKYRNTKGAEKIEYVSENTKIIGYKIDNKIFIEDITQI